MGKRRGRKSFQRTPARRSVYEKILIVCEDSCTAPKYLNAYILALGLPKTIEIIATGDSDPTPDKVVAYALNWLENEKKSDGFGEHKTTVFCVIDRDEHATFDQALATLRGASENRGNDKKKITIKVFPSYPSFEVWFILHHKYTRQSFSRSGRKSPADMVVKELKTCPTFGDYNKSAANHYQLLANLLPTAITNAVRSKADAINTGELNSSTDVHLLIAYLSALKDKIEDEKNKSRQA